MDAKTTEWIQEQFDEVLDNQETILANQEKIMEKLGIEEDKEEEANEDDDKLDF